MPKSLLTIGRLKEIELLDPATQKQGKITFRNEWLAWDTTKRNFVICVVRSRVSQSVNSSVAKAHRRFHSADASSGALLAEAPQKSGSCKVVGLVKALVYQVPKQIKSPSKKQHFWHHAMGDTGHEGRNDYPVSVMPALLKDARGNFFFKRRRGNIYTVDEWLRG